MENATKALVMAGSVLIAVIIIALLYSFLSTLSANAEQEDLKLLAEQTEKFNKEYEAFERKLMRGTDLITLINKAIANNKKYDDQDKIYDIDVKFTLSSDITKVIVEVVNGKAQPASREEIVFNSSKVYSVIDNKSPDRINQKLYEFMNDGLQPSKDAYVLEDYDGPDDKDYKKIYDNYIVFKRKFFTCTKLEYSEQTGRVNLLEFQEIELAGGELEGYN